MSDTTNGWNEYSKLVINELERLNDSISKLNKEIQSLKQEITEMKVREDAVSELKAWKSAVDEVSSPSQLKYVIKDVEKLKTFKTQAVTIFLIVQALIALAFGAIKYFS
jgi:cell division septum initiation protein DivIVA|tara:strand:- start:62 stop:388 length:327 start_codon:yes stop_codon:yes gene_type:complete